MRQIRLFSILMLLSLVSIYSVSLYAQVKHTLHEKSFNVQSGELLDIKTDVGDINIKTWNKNEVFVKVYGNSTAEKELEFSFDRTSDGVKIVVEKKSKSWFGGWFNSLKLRFDVLTPENFNSKLRTSGGDISVENQSGELKVSTSGGDITIYNHTGESDVSTSGGDIEFTKSTGDLSASTSGGDISLHVSNGKIQCSTSGGDVRLNYQGENRGISLSTSGGDIDVIVPRDLKADVDLRTSGGDVECDTDNTREISKKRSKLSAEMNGGGPRLDARTSGGDISVRNR